MHAYVLKYICMNICECMCENNFNSSIMKIILFSDPHCVLAVLDKKQFDSMVVHRNFLDWKEQQHISNIYRSSVKEKTLDPEWNETFEL